MTEDVLFKMRFRPRRLIKVLTVCLLLWVLVTIVQFLWTHFLGEEEDEIELGPPEPDTNIPASFLRSAEGTSTPVVVVEEHYEVLKYWFAASESGLISRQGNVLFHIDGHADLSTSLIIDNIPLFRPPRNIQEVNNMMQRNDAFVLAATLGGLIERYIWVWPPWDRPNHNEDHVIIDVQIGSMMVSSGTTPLELCMCFEIHGSDHSECRLRNSSDPEGDGSLIDASQCNLNISGTAEFVSEEKAISLLESGDWVTARQNVILDIDEDYYGCESAGGPLYSSGLSSDLLEALSNIFSEIFCARNVHHETQSDTFFHSFVELISKLRKEVEENHKKSKKEKYKAVQMVLYSMLPDIYESLKESSLRSILCTDPEDPVIELLLQGVVRHMAHLNLTQLTNLAEAGLCLRFSPKNLFYDVSESLQVCEGKVSPNSTDVLFHTPTPFEIHERTINLRKMLKSRFLKPSLVTVCRSVRDGYTPRKLFPRIEADIIKLLHEAFTDVHYASVYHDTDLLGYTSGWHGRSFIFKDTFIYKLIQKYAPEMRKYGFINI